jgi:rhodanese-related sulfurtransferase
MTAIIGVLVVAAAASLGDFVWYTFGIRHSVAAGLVHGAVLLTAVGAVLGFANGHMLRGLPIGALAGLGGAVAYNVLIALLDRRTYGSAIPSAWVIMWLILAACEGRWLHLPARRTWSAVAGRGLFAALTSGIAFSLVINTLWGRPPADGRNYLVQFLAWAFAWAPGLLTLTSGTHLRLSHPPSSTSRSGAPKKALEPSHSIRAADLLERIDRGESLRILDVRSEREFARGHVPHAVNIPFTQVASRIDAVPGTAEEELILYCGHGPRAYLAAAALRRAGRARIVYLTGHWAAWQAAGLRVER